jgi:ssDNA-binding replication factor A large subunit
MFSMKEIVKEISQASGLSEKEVEDKIEEKQIELSGLVSPEGAAYIVGKELGVNLLKESAGRRLKIKNVTPGMWSVDLTGRAVRISKKRDFERDGKTKGVINLIIGDETGILRLSLWDYETELIEKLGIKAGDVVNIRNAYVKENGRGDVELRLGRAGKISKSNGEIPSLENIKVNFETTKTKNISDINEEEYSEVRASVLQVFTKNPLYEVCPKCESRLEKEGNAWSCKEHGHVEPKYNIVISGVIDDDSGNMRAVFFRDLAEKISGMTIDSIGNVLSAGSDTASEINEIIELGKEFVIRGKVKKNKFTEKMELVANEVEEIDPKNESEKLIEKIERLKIKIPK